MSPEIRDLLGDAADDSARSPIDAGRLVVRGRIKVRHRRVGAIAGAAAVVAAAIGITGIQSLTATGPLPPAATSPSPTSPESTDPTSGAELLKKLSYAEGVDRCQARMLAEYGEPGTPDPFPPIAPGEGLQYGMYVSDLLPMRLENGQQAVCSVPGTVRPSPDEPTGGSVPGDPRKECGRLTWTNLTGWTVVEQRDSTGGFAATLLSDDGQAVLICDVDGPGATRRPADRGGPFPNAYVFLVYGPSSGSSWAPNGLVGSGLDSTEIHWLTSVRDGRQFWGGGGIAAKNAVRYTLFAGDRELAEALVQHGVYAMRVWLPAGVSAPTLVRVYDAAGNVIEEYPPS